MKILIGAPVYKRAWILKHWFQCIESQTVDLKDIGFIFECERSDEDTVNLLSEWHSKHPQVAYFNIGFNSRIEHKEHPNGVRRWTQDRYKDMADLRNCLLSRVRVLNPERYMSLDSDILLTNPRTLETLFEITGDQADAAAPLMFMTPESKKAPSTMTWVGGRVGERAMRASYPLGERFETDVIMAAKMMNQKVYNTVNYFTHRQGEDLGWSAVCGRLGYTLYCVSDLYAPHIMSEQMLERFLEKGDPRVDFLHEKI